MNPLLKSNPSFGVTFYMPSIKPKKAVKPLGNQLLTISLTSPKWSESGLGQRRKVYVGDNQPLLFQTSTNTKHPLGAHYRPYYLFFKGLHRILASHFVTNLVKICDNFLLTRIGFISPDSQFLVASPLRIPILLVPGAAATDLCVNESKLCCPTILR